MLKAFYWPVLVLLGALTGAVAAEVDSKYVEIGKKGIEASHRGDLMTAMTLLQQAAEQGYAPAQVELAYLLDKADYNEQAFHWYQQAAQLGDAAGQFGLASLYASGEGVGKDLEQARELFEQSVQQKHYPALYVVAQALEKGGMGFELDPRRALELYRECHAGGERGCTERLARAYSKGELGLAIDRDKAMEIRGSLEKSEK